MDRATLKQYTDAAGAAWRADSKRSWTLTALLAVLAIVVGRQILRQSPGQAVAAPPTRSNLADRESAAASSGVPHPSIGQWASQKYSVPEHNYFVPRLEYYPLPDGSLSDDNAEADAQRKAKLDQLAADEKKERQNLLDQLRAAAASLELETTVMTPTPKAMISGNLVCEGDEISGFRVVRICPRYVLLENQGVQVELAMN